MNFQNKIISIIVILGYLFIAIAFFIKPILNNEAISPSDLIYRFANFSYLVDKDFRPSNDLLSDQTLQFEPWRLYARQQIREGKIPWSNPYQGGGVPLIGNDQSALFFPTTILFFLLPVNFATVLAAVLKLVFASFGGYLFLKSYRMSEYVSFIGGILVGFSGFNIVWLSHPHSNVSIFLPWLFLLTRLLLEYDLTSKIRIFYSTIFGTLVLMQFLGGHIETSFHVCFATALYSIFLLTNDRDSTVVLKVELWRRIRKLGLYALPVIIATAFAMVQLLPFILYLKDSFALSYRSAHIENPYGQPLGALATWIVPNIFGNPRDDVSLSRLPTISLSEGVILDNSIKTNFNESVQGYTSFLFIVLSPLALLIRRERKFVIFLALLNIFILIVTFRLPPFFRIITSIPPFDISANHRLLLVFGFINVILGSLVLDRVFKRNEYFFVKGNRMLERGYLYLLPLPILTTGLIGYLFIPTVRYITYSYRSVLIFIFIASLTYWIFLLFFKKNISIKNFFLGLILIIILDVFVYGFNYNPTYNLENGYPITPGIQFLQKNTDTEKVLFIGLTLPPNLATYYRIHDLRNYDAMQNREFTNQFHAAFSTNGSWELINYLPSMEAIKAANSQYKFNIRYIAIGTNSDLMENFITCYSQNIVYKGNDLIVADIVDVVNN